MNVLQQLPDLLPNYIGGQIEIQGMNHGEKSFSPKYLYRGEIENVVIDDENVVVVMSWVAQMEIGTGKWKLAENKPCIMDMRLYSVGNIGPGREGSDRLCFQSSIAEELVVLFPPDGSKLDTSRIDGWQQGDGWGQWEEVVCEDNDLEILAGASKGVKVVRNKLYQVIIRSLMPKDDCVEQLPEMVWLSIKSIDQSASHDWRHFQRIKNELVGPECEGVELYPAESRCVDSSNQYHLFVMSNPQFRMPFGFKERLVLDDVELCQLLGAKQRPFDRNWPSSTSDNDELITAKIRKIKDGIQSSGKEP